MNSLTNLVYGPKSGSVLFRPPASVQQDSLETFRVEQLEHDRLARWFQVSEDLKSNKTKC